MDALGIQKVWNANVRTKPASSTATTMMMPASTSARFRRRGPP